MAVTAAVEPTAKYSLYRAEVEARLGGKLSGRERRRLEAELRLLERGRFVEVGGVAHHYIEAGPPGGEPLLLVHGWACSAYWWHHAIDPLAQAGYRVIAYDLRGHGFSGGDQRGDYSVAGLSADLRGLAAALGLPRHHVAAFSLGALAALHYAAAHPEQVRSLALFNFGLSRYKRSAILLPAILDLIFNRVLRPLERRGPWWLPAIPALALLTRNLVPASDMQLATLALRCCEPEAVRAGARELARREVLGAVGEQMARVERPALLVAGAGDPLMHAQDGRRLVELAPNGQYLEVPRCGHLMLFELPEQVVSILRLFLRSARG